MTVMLLSSIVLLGTGEVGMSIAALCMLCLRKATNNTYTNPYNASALPWSQPTRQAYQNSSA